MAGKNEVPFYTQDGNINGISFPVSTTTTVFTAGTNGAKLYFIGFFDSWLQNGGSLADMSILVKIIINSGTGDKNFATYFKINPTISTRLRLDQENIIDSLLLQKDRSGNKFMLLKAGAVVKINYVLGGSGGSSQCNGFGVYGEDF